MKQWIQFFRNRRGAAAVEFALIAPIFVFGIVITTEFGLAAYDKMKLTAGLRSATQYVMQGGTDANVIKTIVEDTAGFTPTLVSKSYCVCSDAPSVQIVCTDVCPGAVRQSYTTISGSYTRTILVKSFTLTSDIELRSY